MICPYRNLYISGARPRVLKRKLVIREASIFASGGPHKGWKIRRDEESILRYRKYTSGLKKKVKKIILAITHGVAVLGTNCFWSVSKLYVVQIISIRVLDVAVAVFTANTVTTISLFYHAAGQRKKQTPWAKTGERKITEKITLL